VLVETTGDTSLPGDDLRRAFGVRNRQRRLAADCDGFPQDRRVLRRFSTHSDSVLSASPDGEHAVLFSGAMWAQPVAGGEPKRITEGIDVTLDDPRAKHPYVKRAKKGTIGMIRIPVAGGDPEELPRQPNTT
jgi:hypothetical protein